MLWLDLVRLLSTGHQSTEIVPSAAAQTTAMHALPAVALFEPVRSIGAGAVGVKVPADLRLTELHSNVFRVDQVSQPLPWNLERCTLHDATGTCIANDSALPLVQTSPNAASGADAQLLHSL